MKMSISKKILMLVIIPCLTIGTSISMFGARINENSLAREIEYRLSATGYSISQTMGHLTLKVEMDKVIQDFHKETGI